MDSKDVNLIRTEPIQQSNWNKLKSLLSPYTNSTKDEQDEGSESSEEENGDTVDELLFGAQMDLIAHHPIAAKKKLERAAELPNRSSAACATLASIYSRGTRISTRPSISPTSPTLLTHSTERKRTNSTSSNPSLEQIEQDSLKAAMWAYKGLSIELAKPSKAANLTTKNLSGEEEESGSEDGHEGVAFGLERALDLVIGLTDAFRFGVLRPQAQGAVKDEAAELWEKGAILASKTLAHPSVLVAITPKIDIVTKATEKVDSNGEILLPSTSSLSSRPLLVPTPIRPQSVRRTSSARSYTHPSSSTSQHHSPIVKLQLTIQVHLLYLLALQIFPADSKQSEKLWKEILKISGSLGLIGNKEGDEIVQKTRKRLEQLKGTLPDSNEWKVAKGRKDYDRKKSVELSTSPTVPEEESYFPFGSLNRESGDALSGIWKLKKDKATSRQNSLDSDQTQSTLQSSLLINKSSTASSNLTESRPTSVKPSTAGEPVKRKDAEESSESRTSKFHFAEDYPSPPQSPTTRSRRTSSTSPIASPSKLLPVSRSQFIGIKHRGSNSSFQPPKLLPRNKSSASVSTLPPDFFSTKSKNGFNFNESHRVTIGGSKLNPTATFTSEFISPPTPTPNWKDSIKNRAQSFSVGSIKVAYSLKSKLPFTNEVKEKSAVGNLRNLLKRNDNSGLYWAEVDENAEPTIESIGSEEETEEGDGERVEEVERMKSKRLEPLRANLRPQRSFVDPTRPSNLSPSPSFTSLTTALPKPNPNSNQIDPVLLALEKASQLGSKSICAKEDCRKRGWNFPKCRCGASFCCRECRMSNEGGKHVCAERGEGKGKGRAV